MLSRGGLGLASGLGGSSRLRSPAQEFAGRHRKRGRPSGRGGFGVFGHFCGTASPHRSSSHGLQGAVGGPLSDADDFDGHGDSDRGHGFGHETGPGHRKAGDIGGCGRLAVVDGSCHRVRRFVRIRWLGEMRRPKGTIHISSSCTASLALVWTACGCRAIPSHCPVCLVPGPPCIRCSTRGSPV